MGSIIVLLIIISIPTWFLTRRLLLPDYVYNGDKLIHKNDVYMLSNTDTSADRKNLGRQIGVAMREHSKLRLIAESILGDTVYEFKDDKEHNRIFVHVFMDGSFTYGKVSK